VAVEGCTGWRYVVEEVVAAGFEAHLAEPADTQAARGRKRHAKTDRSDCRLLRELLAGGRLPESWIPPTAVLEWRERVRLYKSLVDQRTTWVQRIHAELYQHGVALPESSIRWAKTREALEVDELELSPAARQRIAVGYRMIDAITVESRPLKADLQRFGRHQPGCGALVDSQYGIGGLLAVAGACSSNTRSSILSSLDCSPHPHRVLKHGWAVDCPISGADIAHLPRPPTPAPRRCVTESASALTLSGTAGDARVLPRSGAGRVSQSGRWRRRHRGPAPTRDRSPMVTPRERGSSPKYRAEARRVHQCAALVAAHE